MIEPLRALGASVGLAVLVVCLVLLASGGLKSYSQNVVKPLSLESYAASDGGYIYSFSSLLDTPVAIYTNDWGNMTLCSDVSGTLYRSTDHGDSWSVQEDAFGGEVMYGAVMTGDGKEIIVGTAEGGVFYSQDFGESFKYQTSGLQHNRGERGSQTSGMHRRGSGRPEQHLLHDEQRKAVD